MLPTYKHQQRTALRLCRMQNQYLIARDYKPWLADKQFQEVSKITRTEEKARRTKKNQVNKIKFLTDYNLSLSKMDFLENIFLFLTVMTVLNSYFQQIRLATIFRRNKNLKELLAPSKCPNPKNNRHNSMTSCQMWLLQKCHEKCDTFKN